MAVSAGICKALSYLHSTRSSTWGSLASSSILIPFPKGETLSPPVHLFRFLIDKVGIGIPTPGVHLGYFLIISHMNGNRTGDKTSPPPNII